MKSMLLLEYILIFLNVCNFTFGSKIVLETTPNDIKDGLTNSLSLRCALHDTAPSASVIGRRDVTDTQDNIADVSAILLMHGGKDVASVTHTAGPEVLDASINLHVTGTTVPGNSGEQAYLEVQIANPTANQSGEYQCEISSVRRGHNLVFSTTAEVTISTPTTTDMVNYMRNNNNEIQQLKSQINTKVLFTAVLTKELTVAAQQTVLFDKVYVNIGGDYNQTTGEFICSTPGHYHFSFSAFLNPARPHAFLILYQNNNTALAIYGTVSNHYEMLSNSGILTLTKGDVVKIVAFDNSNIYNNDRDVYTTFSGHLLAAL